MGREENACTIRVTIQQPALPKYRVPVFRELARRPGLRVRVHYAIEGAVPSVSGDGFETEASRVRHCRGLHWHTAHWSAASRRRTDVLILSWNVRDLGLIPALIRARMNGVPTILWGHGMSKNETWLRRQMRNLVGRLADAVMVYNHTAARELVRQGIPRERVHIALNSLDQTPIWQASEACRGAQEALGDFRRTQGIDGPLVLFVSRLEPANRVDLLLRAAAQLMPRHPRLRVAIIGRGPAGSELEALATELGVRHAVLFPGAIYEERMLAPWFLSAAVFCYPSNMGLSLIHAFGYGVPVVTGNARELHGPEIEALDDGVNGLFFRDGDVDDLAAALERVITDEDLRRRLGAAALKTVEERFSLARMVDGMEGAIRRVLTVGHTEDSAPVSVADGAAGRP